MGTGPWPQPPTEAEQLQALMAAANGESDTPSYSFLSIPCQTYFFSLRVHMDAWEVLVCVSSCLLGQHPARLIH